ncbi:HinT-interacting membrane complex lipoprotein P60 [Mycoplasma todarodis]|uniref:Lipoprotein n=1 Tax=Mycoplasma todarodis TaxID=1937191 RepID=A0A4R0XJD0_9MOLU|nr:hypothetical protein [Mycoplasma todarodis]TCG10723.1 hypothetical protein C4B25_03205 [Mycoplasma todarodis]
MKLNKKIILPFASLVTISAPIAVAISCGNSEKTAEENQKDSILKSGSDYLLETYLSAVNKNEFGEKEYQKNLKAAWKFWAASKIMTSNTYWADQVKGLKAEGDRGGASWDDADFTNGKVWISGTDGKEIKLKTGDDIKAKTYPSWELAQEIMKKKPTLKWGLELENLLMVQRYLTSFKESEFKKVYKKEKDEPKNYDRTDQYFFFEKYLKENTPTLIWKQSVTDQLDRGPISQEVIKSAAEFNALNPRAHSLQKPNLVKDNWLETAKDNKDKTHPTLTDKLGDLYNFKGISSAGISKGELDYSDSALRKRLKDNQSESGWVNKDGNIENEAHVIIGEKSTDSIYAMQFLPWFDAKDSNGKQIDDVKKAGEIDNDKSFWRLDSFLLTKDKKNVTENGQKLIFTLAQADSGLITNARKFMLDIRQYHLRTDNEDLREILLGKDVIKK